MLIFDWDAANTSHIARHGISPEEAEEVVRNRPFDLGRRLFNGELRFAQVGETVAGRILHVVTTERTDKVRVVTAYVANEKLRRYYATQKRNRL